MFDSQKWCKLEKQYDFSFENTKAMNDSGLKIVCLQDDYCVVSTAGLTTAIRQKHSIIVSEKSFELLSSRTVAVCGICVSGKVAEGFADLAEKLFYVDGSKIPDAVQSLLSLAQYGENIASEKASAMIYQILCEISASQKKTESHYPELINVAIELIHRNYAELYGVEELAEELKVSKSHLVRAFSAAVGVPPGKYLAAVRVAAAKRLLLNNGYPVEVVATLSGFSGANYFCKVFKNETGKSPLEYRKNFLYTESQPEMDEMEKRLFL